MPNKSSSSSTTIVVNTSPSFRKVLVNVLSAIFTHNIAKWGGGNDNTQDAVIASLETAVHELVERNPVLSGFLKLDATGNKRPGIFVETGKFSQFLHHIPAPEGIPSPAAWCNTSDNTSSKLMMDYVKAFIEPHVPAVVRGKDEIEQKLPVFGIHIMVLPDGYIYYAPRLSHMVGDGRTYYMLLEELNALFAKKTTTGRTTTTTTPTLPKPIVWESNAAAQFDFSHELGKLRYWFGIFAAIMVYKVCGFAKTQTLFLSKEKIDKKKNELAKNNKRGGGGGPHYLSTNDIVTAALAENAARNYNGVFQAICFRSHWPGVGDRDAGNVVRIVPMSTRDAANPHNVRAFAKSISQYFNKDTNCWMAVSGRSYNQTNWAGLTRVLDGTIFHAPSTTLVTRACVPLAVIFQPNQDEIGVVHKLKDIDTSVGLLSELLA
jgi:hypothetical protein